AWQRRLGQYEIAAAAHARQPHPVTGRVGTRTGDQGRHAAGPAPEQLDGRAGPKAGGRFPQALLVVVPEGPVSIMPISTEARYPTKQFVFFPKSRRTTRASHLTPRQQLLNAGHRNRRALPSC